MRTTEQEPREGERERELLRFRGLSPAQAGRLARPQVCEDTVRAWIDAGELTATNIGTTERPRWRIMREDMDACLERRRVNPGAAA